MMDYGITRSKRKTVALYVRDGRVEVRAPLDTPKSYIDSFVSSKEDWIKGRLAGSKAQLKQREGFVVNYGSMMLYRGEEYPVVAKDKGRVSFDGTAFEVPPELLPEDIKAACVQIYRLLARRDLTEKAMELAKQMGVEPSAVKITAAKTRWGSCSMQKSINFSWRLIMAEDYVIDYVVAHELAHIVEMNHSERFWAVVETVFPDYVRRRERLYELQKRLATEDWD